MKKWKKITLISIALILLLGLLFAILFFGVFKKGTILEDLEEIFNGEYTRDDNFPGTDTGDGGNDRDGVFNSLAISPTDPNLVYLGTEGNSIFRSKDGGTTWEWIRGGIWHNNRGYAEVYDIVFDPKDESILYAALTNGPVSPSSDESAGFYKTGNRGDYWDRLIDGLPNTGANSVAVMENPDTLFVGLDGDFPSRGKLEDRPQGGIYKSSDNGQTWQKVNIPEKGIYNRFTHIEIIENTIYASGMSFGPEDGERRPDPDLSVGLIKSTDGGDNWEIIQPPGTLSYYYDTSSDGKTIYFTDALGEGGGYKSTDGGATWEELNLYFSNALEVSLFNGEFVIYSSGGQISKSTDGMKTGKQVFKLSEGSGFDDIEFTSDENIIYAAGDGYRVYKSTDAGETWEQIANLRNFIDSHD